MKREDVPDFLVAQFEAGEVPCDEPPGLTEYAYRAWKEAGGIVKPHARSSGAPLPFTHPEKDPANGRWLCSRRHPRPANAPASSRWAHEDVEEGEQENGWPSGDTVRCRCLVCGETWRYELPQ